MALPKIEHPLYEVKLTSQRKPVKFRPFLVKEQKLLLMAAESGDYEEVISAMKQIINNCVVSDKFDVDKLPMVDIELMFLHLRAKSVGENIEVFFKCTNEVEGNPCGMVINVEVDLLQEVQTTVPLEKNIIMIDENIGIRMRYPRLDDIILMKDLKEEEMNVNLIASCIDQIFDKEEVYNAEESSIEEMLTFIEDVPSKVYDQMTAFLEDTPTIICEKEAECPKCKFPHKVKLEGMQDFFI